ncbi:type II toxin-antitoxin system RelE/ParE family toxin [Thiomonas sp.]
MAIIILPDAQADLLALQDYMLEKWGEAAWEIAENEIFEKLAKIESGVLNGTPIQQLAAIGMTDYLGVLTSHHKLVYRRIDRTVYVYLAAGHRQDFPNILVNRMLRR